jgi:hypothetical protein
LYLHRTGTRRRLLLAPRRARSLDTRRESRLPHPSGSWHWPGNGATRTRLRSMPPLPPNRLLPLLQV